MKQKNHQKYHFIFLELHYSLFGYKIMLLSSESEVKLSFETPGHLERQISLLSLVGLFIPFDKSLSKGFIVFELRVF